MEKEEIIDTIKQFACSLAEKELADKYGVIGNFVSSKIGKVKST